MFFGLLPTDARDAQTAPASLGAGVTGEVTGVNLENMENTAGAGGVPEAKNKCISGKTQNVKMWAEPSSKVVLRLSTDRFVAFEAASSTFDSEKAAGKSDCK